MEAINSLRDKANNPASIEIILAVDYDDERSNRKLKNFVANDPYKNITMLYFDRKPYREHTVYINEMARIAKGNWVFSYNDDTFMETEGWDDVILGQEEFCVLSPTFPNLAAVRRHAGKKSEMKTYCVMPIVPKDWINVLGFYCPPEQPWLDTWVMDTAKRIGIFKMEPRIEIYHRRFKDSKDPTLNDKTYREGLKARKKIPGSVSRNSTHNKRARIDAADKISDFLKKE